MANAKMRSRRDGLPFNLVLADINIPEVCPLLGIPLLRGNKQKYDNAPSLDRIDCKFGYTKDNVWVISKRANMIKSNASLEELLTIAENLRIVLETLGMNRLDAKE